MVAATEPPAASDGAVPAGHAVRPGGEWGDGVPVRRGRHLADGAGGLGPVDVHAVRPDLDQPVSSGRGPGGVRATVRAAGATTALRVARPRWLPVPAGP